MESFRGKKMIECEGGIKALLDKYGLKLEGTVARSQKVHPRWANKCGIRYRVTLSRPKVHALTYTFDFWDSVAANERGELLRGDVVLECAVSDCRSPDTLRDFCWEYGYEPDKNATVTFNHIQKFKEGIFSVINETEWMEFSELFDVIVNP